MPRFARCLGMLSLALAMAMPALGEDKPSTSSSSSSPGSDTEKPAPKDKFVYVARLQGTVTAIDATQGTVALLVHYKAPNQQAFQKMAQLQQREMQQEMQVMQSMMRQIASRSNGRSRNYRPPRGSSAQSQLNKTVNQMRQVAPKLYDDKTQIVDLMLAEDVQVRVAMPPEEFDDKGKRKSYSPEELKTLKGNTKLWGFPGELGTLQVGHTVQVFVARKKTAHPPGHKETADELEENPPLIKVLYLSPAPPQPVAANKSPAKPAAKK